MARPRAGDWLDDELRSLAHQGVDRLVSLLTLAEQFELGLLDEDEYCVRHGIAYSSLPILDRQTPVLNEELIASLGELAQELAVGQTLVIHCRMGVGRSAMIAAALLALHGVSAESAFAAIALARGCAVPDTAEQRSWAEQFAGLALRLRTAEPC